MKKAISDPCVEQFFTFLKKVFQNKVKYSDLKYRVNETLKRSFSFSFTPIPFKNNLLDPYAFSIYVLNRENDFFPGEVVLSLRLSDHKVLGSEKEIVLQFLMADEKRARLVMPGLKVDYLGDHSSFDEECFNSLIGEIYSHIDLMEFVTKIVSPETLKPKAKYSRKKLNKARDALKLMPAC